MMFLMNDVVLNLDSRDRPPLPAARFHALTVQAVVRLGSELFAQSPRLQHTDPEKARRLATLILAKAPEVNAALFVAPAEKCPPDQVMNRFANLSIEWSPTSIRASSAANSTPSPPTAKSGAASPPDGDHALNL